MPNRKIFLILFLSAFIFRLAFGLFRSQIWEVDQFQTYLIGLKCFTTHSWPFFGPDVNGLENKAFQSQIPGAMEGLLIGLPFYVLPIPEAPFILLNLLSMIGVALLTWYIVRRLPEISYIWLFIWISIVPWSIQESTTIINPAFTFLPAVLFFIGFMESIPCFSLSLIQPFWANAAMGFSLFWIMQFHFSYVYCVPLAVLSLILQTFHAKRPAAFLYFILGCLPTLALIIPTYIQYGLERNNVSSGFVVAFNWGNVREFGVILARFLSLVCFELPRFLGITTPLRIRFLTDHAWLFVPGAVLWIGGLIQPFILFFIWCRQLFENLWRSRLSENSIRPQWKELTWLITGAFGMVYASFWFTIKMPLSHIYFVLFPLIMTFSCYCWVRFKDKKTWVILAKAFVILGVVFQFGYAITVAPRDSIYPIRGVINQSIHSGDYRVLGLRRPGSLY